MARTTRTATRNTSAARAARGTKGKRDPNRDRWQLQVTIDLPIDGELSVRDLKKYIEDQDGTFTIRSRVLKRGYEAPPSNDGEGGIPTLEEIDEAEKED